MSSLGDREREIRQKLKDNFTHYADRCLKVRTKTGATVPFKVNRSQQYLHERLEAQKKKTGKVRALVLKGRQVGISTYVGGRFYHRSTHANGYRTFILAHLDAASDGLFAMAKRYHENCPEVVRPQTGSANAKELTFPGLDGGYKVATAGSKEVGRSETIQLFHGSEVGFWPNAELHFAGVMQALADSPGTECILESTANGIGNTFHALWKAAERGESEFEAIFIPWFWHEEYVRKSPKDWTAPDVFREYAAHYDLTPDQTYWAYCKNRDLAVVAGGAASEINWKFRQEYPANADEAFQTSGVASLIAPEKVVEARKKSVEGYGPIVLGIDPARGGGDKTGIIDRQGRRMGQHICERLDRDDLMALAGEIQHIAKRIKPVKVVVDTTGLGAGLYDRLRELLGDKVEGVNFGSRAYDRDRYANRRAEMWDQMREWFDDPAGVQVPDQDGLQGDLCAVPAAGNVPGGTRFNSSGQLILEAKDHIKERLTFSPDLGDAAALTFAVDLTDVLVEDLYEAGPMSEGSWMGA